MTSKTIKEINILLKVMSLNLTVTSVRKCVSSKSNLKMCMNSKHKTNLCTTVKYVDMVQITSMTFYRKGSAHQKRMLSKLKSSSVIFVRRICYKAAFTETFVLRQLCHCGKKNYECTECKPSNGLNQQNLWKNIGYRGNSIIKVPT